MVCANCDATLPSGKRTAWDPETRTPIEQWGEERLYWKTRLMARLRIGGALETINEVLGWFLKKEESELKVKNLYLDVTSSQANNGRARRSETNQASLQAVIKAVPVKVNKRSRTRQSTPQKIQKTSLTEGVRTRATPWRISTIKNGQKRTREEGLQETGTCHDEVNDAIVTDLAGREMVRASEAGRSMSSTRRRLFVDDARGVCQGHEDEFNGRERYLNGQVVGARVNEAGLDVTEDDGRGGRSTPHNDRDEKVMGKRDCDEFEEWDDD